MELFTKDKIFTIKEIGSTNKYAACLPTDTEEGKVIVARFQTHGRGQGSNFWESEAGKNLTLSIILKPEFLPITDQFYISKIISLAIADLLATYVKNISIKWPNDIYVGEKKIAGILIENSISGSNLMQSIIGMGININQGKFTSEAPNPVSLLQITGKEHDLNTALKKLLELTEYYYNSLKNDDFDAIDARYLKYLFRYQKASEFMADGKTFRGTIIAVERTGELLIQDDKAGIRKFMHREVEYIIKN